MAKSVVQIKQLQFGYRVGAFRLAVDSLNIAAQERVALIGPSGCGKTTLLNLLAGIFAPAQGEISVDGTSISGLNQEDRQDFRALHMGLVFQEFELLEYLTVLDNVLLPFRLNLFRFVGHGGTESARLEGKRQCTSVEWGIKGFVAC